MDPKTPYTLCYLPTQHYISPNQELFIIFHQKRVEIPQMSSPFLSFVRLRQVAYLISIRLPTGVQSRGWEQ